MIARRLIGGCIVSEQKTYDMEYDREEACQFCGRIYTEL